MSDLYTEYMQDCTVFVGSLPMDYTTVSRNKINYIYIGDYIVFEYLDILIDSLKLHVDRHFVLITEHWLPENFFNKYGNIIGVNYIYNRYQMFNKINSDPLGITHMKGECVLPQPELFTLCDSIETTQPHKVFSILLGNKNPLDRHQIYSFLHYFKILDKCNYTIKKNKNFYQIYDDCPDLFEDRLNKSYTLITENITHVGTPTPHDEYRFDHKKNIKSIADVVENSTVYISLENRPLDDIGGYICEKSLYGFIFKKPTVHIGLPNNMHVLEQMGFRSFEPIISQYFNKIENSNEKIIALCKELLFIQNLNQSFLDAWHTQIKSIITHNRIVVQKLPESSLTEWKNLVVKLKNIEKILLQKK